MEGSTIILILMALTLSILVVGIVLMAIGGKLNSKLSNKLMVARVLVQFIVVMLLAFFYFLGKK